MRIAATSARGGGGLSVMLGVWLMALPTLAHAQLFDIPLRRPPADVPGVTPGPAQNIAPANPNPPASPPKGPMLQSLPPAASPATPPSHTQSVPAGQVALMLSARYGRDLPAITNGLHWRVFPNKAEPGA